MFIQSRVVSSENHDIPTSVVQKSYFNMKWVFAAIQGYLYWCKQKSRTGCCNVQQCQPYFRNLQRYRAGKLQIRPFQHLHSGLTTVSEKRFRISRNIMYMYRVGQIKRRHCAFLLVTNECIYQNL